MTFPRTAPLLGALVLAAGTLATTSLSGCVSDKEEIKGQVDDSLPPGSPNGDTIGKADNAGRMIAVDYQSPHPYTNDYGAKTRIDLNGMLESCASRARLHFSVARTERNYDYINVTGFVGGQSEHWDGDHDDTWTRWFDLGADKHIDVELVSDYSITDHGFEIDVVEWDGSAICPAVAYPPCQAGTVDTNGPVPTCGCPQFATCVPVADIEVRRNVFRGFNNTGKRIVGTDAFTTKPGPNDAPVSTLVGSVREQRVLDLVRAAAMNGLFEMDAYSEFGEWSEYFYIRAGDKEISFTAPQGEHNAEVSKVIADFLSLFECGAADQPLACDSDLACSSGECIAADTCICTEQYQPVCGANGQTYSNDCFAGCAGVGVVHPGECGIAGDVCGTLLGRVCNAGFKCRYATSGLGLPFPDEGGRCVPETECDAPVHCEDLIHIATVGAWACVDHSCEWHTGSVWQYGGVQLNTSHPYANDTNQWQQAYMPAGAEAMRLDTHGAFELEDGYDFLEVWSWRNNRWQRDVRTTGTTGPALGDEFPGRYHYLHFVSDYSVTKHGFEVETQYR